MNERISTGETVRMALTTLKSNRLRSLRAKSQVNKTSFVSEQIKIFELIIALLIQH